MRSSSLTIWLLFVVTSLIWGSTWIAIQFQLGVVSPLWSVAYRFVIAAAILLGYCMMARLPLKFSWRTHGWFMALGALLFALNYVLFYFGSVYFISGLVGILFAFILPMNILQARFFFATPLTRYMIFGSIIGFIGLALISWTQVNTLYLQGDKLELQHIMVGLAFCLIGTWVASCGQMIAANIQRQNIPIIQSNTWGMLYGALFLTLFAILSGQKPSFDMSPQYIISLLYLAIFGTVLAFGAYISLIGRIGPGRAGYIFVITPLITMIISSWQEGFAWDSWVLLGTVLIIWGSAWALKRQ